MSCIPYLCIILLNVANTRYKIKEFGKVDGHDLLCIIISLIGCYILNT